MGKEVYTRREKGKITKGYPKKEKKSLILLTIYLKKSL